MNFEEFEELIDESFNNLPNQFRDVLVKNEVKLIPRLKVPKPLQESHPRSVIFGVFIGVPFGRFTNIQTEPTRIELYKESFDRVYKGHEQIVQQIKSTIVHEIAHYFGFSEKQIRERKY